MPLAIKNYGHYWSRNLVNWGTRGKNNSGDMLGYLIDNRKPRVTDFRDQIGIYVLYAEQREVVYIGQAGSGGQQLFLRLRQHTRDHLRDRWQYFSWFGFRKVNGSGELSVAQHNSAKVQGNAKAALDEVEAVLLQLFEPRLNKRGPNWNGSEEYLQYVPREHEDDDEIDENHLLLERLTVIEQKLEDNHG